MTPDELREAYLDALLDRIEDQAEVGHLADLEPVQRDVGTDLETCDRSLEVRHHLQLAAARCAANDSYAGHESLRLAGAPGQAGAGRW